MSGDTQVAFGVGIIDVIIGLSFIFFSLSVIASYLLESLYSITRERARFLKRAVAQLIDQRRNGRVIVGELTKELFTHPLIAKKSVRIDSSARLKIAASGPAYLKPQDFADALLAVLGEKYPHQPSIVGYAEMIRHLPQQESIKSVLTVLLDKSDSIGEFRQHIAAWYADGMERASGSFKRRTQLPLLIIGTVLAVSMDVSTIEYANRLENDGVLRNTLIAEAINQVSSHESEAPDNTKEYLMDVSESIRAFNNDMANFGSNVALRDLNNNLAEMLKKVSTLHAEKDTNTTQNVDEKDSTLLWLLGCIITGVAVSLGTSYWLNFLRLMISVRSSIKPHDTNTGSSASESININKPNVAAAQRVGVSSASFEELLDATRLTEVQEILGLGSEEVTGTMSLATRVALDNWRDNFGLPKGTPLTLEEYMLLINPKRWS